MEKGRNIIKNLLAVLLAMVMSVGFNVNALAAVKADSSTLSLSQEQIEYYANISDTEKASILRNYGFSEKDI